VKLSIDESALPNEMSVGAMIAAAARAGFAAVEPTISDRGALMFETPEAVCREWAEAAVAGGAAVSGLVVEPAWSVALGSPDAMARQGGRDRIVAALDRARWLGAEAITLAPAAVGCPGLAAAATRYEDAHALASEALSDLRFEAERRGVCIACAAGRNGFLVSPIETREFIDTINSPWVGAGLDVADAARPGLAEDWIETMGHRLVRVRFHGLDRTRSTRSGGACTADPTGWPAVARSLERARYSGPVVCCGPGEPAAIKARFEGLLRIG